MSVEETERTVRAYVDAVFEGGDFASYFADDVVWNTTENGDEIRGREAVRGFITTFHTELFDASPEIVNLVFGDGVAGLEAMFVARHIAEFAGVPATGSTVSVPYSMFYEIADGKITTIRAYFPLMALAQQLGSAAAVPV